MRTLYDINVNRKLWGFWVFEYIPITVCVSLNDSYRIVVANVKPCLLFSPLIVVFELETFIFFRYLLSCIRTSREHGSINRRPLIRHLFMVPTWSLYTPSGWRFTLLFPFRCWRNWPESVSYMLMLYLVKRGLQFVNSLWDLNTLISIMVCTRSLLRSMIIVEWRGRWVLYVWWWRRSVIISKLFALLEQLSIPVVLVFLLYL